MKHLFILFTGLCLTVFLPAFGQSLSYEQGVQTARVGLGLGSYYLDGSIKVPPLQVMYEKGIKEQFSIGGILGYAASSTTYPETDLNPYTGNMTTKTQTLDYSFLIVGLRGNYHFWTSEKLDPYLGPTLGYLKVGLKDSGSYDLDLVASGLLVGAQVGANYYFTDKIGAWAEIGYGVGYLNLGATYKF